MIFCKLCQNMMFINSTENNIMCYTCKNCNFQMTEDTQVTISVSDNQIIHNNDVVSKIDKSIKYDSTLPRTNFIQCPNNDCKTRHDKSLENKVIYIKTNAVNMNFTYFCYHCEHFWNNSLKNDMCLKQTI